METYTRDSFITAAVMGLYAAFAYLSTLQILAIKSDPYTALIGAGISFGFAASATLGGRLMPGPPPVVPP